MQSETPFIEHMAKFAQAERLGLHMPGHNQSRAWPQYLRDLLLIADTTELSLTDNLNDPQAALIEAQNLASEYWGSSHTFFVTTGSTTAIKAAVLALKNESNAIFLPRASHQSIMHALAIFKIKPIFLPVISDSYQPLSPLGMPDLEAWTKIFQEFKQKNPNSKMPPMFITAPDYYGSFFALDECLQSAKSFNIEVIVDQAHGAHLKAVPDAARYDALKLGASMVIQSAHKTLPALTPAAYLHLGLNYLGNPQMINITQKALQIMQTSSPSFPIAMTLDYARYYIANYGEKFFADLKISAKTVCDYLQKSGFPNVEYRCGRLIVDTLPLLPATEAAQTLMDLGIDIEMNDWRRLVILLPINLPTNWPEIFINAWDKILPVKEALWQKSIFSSACEILVAEKIYYKILTAGDTADADFYPDLDKLLAGQALIPYPPGIPLLWPGETMSVRQNDLWDKIKRYFT